MADTSERIAQTSNSFPPQATGAVAECPNKAAPPPPAAQPELKKSFELTQDILHTIGARRAPDKKKEKNAWVEIILVDAAGKPMPGVKYRITPPGGQPVEGNLNEHGQAGLYMIESGNCKITFPDLDKDAWE